MLPGKFVTITQGELLVSLKERINVLPRCQLVHRQIVCHTFEDYSLYFLTSGECHIDKKWCDPGNQRMYYLCQYSDWQEGSVIVRPLVTDQCGRV